MDINLVRTCVDELLNTLSLDYIGVIAYGSYISGRSNDFSDLDVMIIRDEHETSDCGSIMIKNIRVEYFIQSLNNLYQLVQKEIENNDPSHLTKFVTCKIIYSTDGKIEQFISYAKKLYETKINPSFSMYEKFSLFSINNRLEDLEGLVNSDSFFAVYYVTLEKIREAYSTIYGILQLPLTKIERLYGNSDFAKKYIASNSHNLPSKDFIDLYSNCLKIDSKELMLKNIKKLYKNSFESLGFDPRNFHLEFCEEAPFRV